MRKKKPQWHPKEGHAFDRLKERYNINYTQALRDYIVWAIRNKKTKLFERRQAYGVETHGIECELKPENSADQKTVFLICQWNINDEHIVTFLAPEHNPKQLKTIIHMGKKKLVYF